MNGLIPKHVFLVVVGAALMTGCSNVAYVGQREIIGIEGKFEATNPTPGQLVVGQEHSTVVAVPPKEPKRGRFFRGDTHQGELLSTISRFDVLPNRERKLDVEIIAEVYSGRAANALTGSDDGTVMVESSGNRLPRNVPLAAETSNADLEALFAGQQEIERKQNHYFGMMNRGELSKSQYDGAMKRLHELQDEWDVVEGKMNPQADKQQGEEAENVVTRVLSPF